MRTKNLRPGLILTALILTAVGLLAQQSSTVRVVIAVNDPSGAGVPKAAIRIVPVPDAAPTMETDSDGKLALDLKPGSYALFVRAQGFRGVDEPVEVREAKEVQTIVVSLRIAGGSSVELQPLSHTDDLEVLASPYHAPMGISPADLKAMPHVTVTVHNPHTSADETYSGVRLADVLAKMNAPLGSELRGEALTNYIIATGSDGYQAVFSLAEVDPAFHPGEVIVADTMNGKPLDAHNGPFKLVVTEDKRPARGVRNLVSIELKTLK
jgi:hypothetical protein